MKTNSNDLYEQLKNILIERGGSYWDAFDALQTIDALSYTAVVDSIIEKLDSVKAEELQELLKSKPDAHKLSEFLSLSPELLEQLHEQKLAEFVQAFKKDSTVTNNGIQPTQPIA